MSGSRVGEYVSVRLLLWLLVSLSAFLALFPDFSPPPLSKINYDQKLGDVLFLVVPGAIVAIASAAEAIVKTRQPPWVTAVLVLNLILVALGFAALKGLPTASSGSDPAIFVSALILGVVVSLASELALSIVLARSR